MPIAGTCKLHLVFYRKRQDSRRQLISLWLREILKGIDFLILSLRSIHMAEESSAPESAVHIVYTEKPQDEEPEAYHIRTLASVVGSEDAAKDALLYSYKSAASGFSAKLTPDQVTAMQNQPGVLQVVPSRTVQLHSGPGNLH